MQNWHSKNKEKETIAVVKKKSKKQAITQLQTAKGLDIGLMIIQTPVFNQDLPHLKESEF